MSRFVEDPKMHENVTRTREVTRHLMDKAERVADLAGALAAEQSGHYRRSIKTTSPEPGQARVYTDDIAGHLIEFGGAKNAAQAPLRRAADVVCDGFKREPK